MLEGGVLKWRDGDSLNERQRHDRKSQFLRGPRNARLGRRHRFLRGRWISHGGPNSEIAVGGGATEGSKHGSLSSAGAISGPDDARGHMRFVKNTHRQRSRVAGTCLYGRLW